jgi:hypothetical protein
MKPCIWYVQWLLISRVHHEKNRCELFFVANIAHTDCVSMAVVSRQTIIVFQYRNKILVATFVTRWLMTQDNSPIARGLQMGHILVHPSKFWMQQMRIRKHHKQTCWLAH